MAATPPDLAPRNRVIEAMNRRRPDRVPVDFGGHRSSGIMAGAYVKLRDYLGLPILPVRIYDVVQQLAVIDEDVLDRFGVDVVELGRGFSLDQSQWQPWRMADGTEALIPAWIDMRREGDDWLIYAPAGRAVGVCKAGSLYFDSIHYPYAEALPDDLSGLASAMAENLWAAGAPPGPGQSDPAQLAAGAKALRESTGRAICGLFGGNLMEWGQFLCRNDNFLMLLAGQPSEATRLLDALGFARVD